MSNIHFKLLSLPKPQSMLSVTSNGSSSPKQQAIASQADLLLEGNENFETQVKDKLTSPSVKEQLLALTILTRMAKDGQLKRYMRPQLDLNYVDTLLGFTTNQDKSLRTTAIALFNALAQNPSKNVQQVLKSKLNALLESGKLKPLINIATTQFGPTLILMTPAAQAFFKQFLRKNQLAEAHYQLLSLLLIPNEAEKFLSPTLYNHLITIFKEKPTNSLYLKLIATAANHKKGAKFIDSLPLITEAHFQGEFLLPTIGLLFAISCSKKGAKALSNYTLITEALCKLPTDQQPPEFKQLMDTLQRTA